MSDVEANFLRNVLVAVSEARKKFKETNRFTRKIFATIILSKLSLPHVKDETSRNEELDKFSENIAKFLIEKKFLTKKLSFTKKAEEFLFDEKLNWNEIHDITDLLDEYQTLAYTSKQYFQVSEKGKFLFKPNMMANFLMKIFTFISTEDGDIYYYKNGVYNSGAEGLIKRACEFFYPDITAHLKQEVLSHIRDSVFIDSQRINQDPFLIHLKNGIYNVKTNKFFDFDEKIFSINKVPIKFVKNQKSKKFEKFVSEIVDEKDVDTIQEMIGYCFFKAYPFHKAMMLIGDGRNGKSTLINVINHLFGSKNISNMSLQTLSNENNIFVEANLFGRMVNLYPDLPAQSIYQTGKFKVLTGNDRITAQRKFKEPLSFKNYAKFIFSCNKLPEVKDNTDAFFRRWLLINFPNKFIEGENANENLEEELTTDEEISGIFNWAMKGLKRLLKQKRFSDQQTTEEIQDLYERLSNSLLAFVKDKIEAQANRWISKEEFFKKYSEYCRENDLPPKSKSLVGRELASLISVNQTKHKNAQGFQTHCWEGISFILTEEEKQKENDQVIQEMKHKIITADNLNEFWEKQKASE